MAMGSYTNHIHEWGNSLGMVIPDGVFQESNFHDGDDDIKTLLQHEVFDPFPYDVELPFQVQDFSRIGERMQWLNNKAEQSDQRQNDVDTGEQVTLDRATPVTEPDIDPPDVGGQSEWSDWQ